jgi:hypothetical protein
MPHLLDRETSEQALEGEQPREMRMARSAQPIPSAARNGSWESPAKSWVGTANSGMPCPRMIGHHRARRVTTAPPAMATSTTPGPKGRSAKSGSVVPQRWKSRALVRIAISRMRTHAAALAAKPSTAERAQSRRSRRGGWDVKSVRSSVLSRRFARYTLS